MLWRLNPSFFDKYSRQNPQNQIRSFMQFLACAKKAAANLWVFNNKFAHFSKKNPLLFYFITFLTHLKSNIFLSNTKKLNRFFGIFPLTSKYCVLIVEIVVQTATRLSQATC